MNNISIVLNARLSSSRLKNKMILPFANSTLFEIALDKYSKINFVDNIYVGIGDDQLITIAKKYNNIKILYREKDSISKGTHNQKITFRHYRDIDSDFILVINPCQPLLSIETIKFALNYFKKNNHKSYTSGVKTGDWIFDSEGIPVTNTDKDNVTTNKNVSYLKASHSFHIINKKRFIKNGYHWEFKKNDPHIIEIPISEIYDVDTKDDFLFTEFMYKRNLND